MFSARSVGGGLDNFIFGDFEAILGDFENWRKPLSSSYVCIYMYIYTHTHVSLSLSLLSKGLLVVLLITKLVKRDVENASASLTGFDTSCSLVLMSVLVSTVSDISLVDNPSMSLAARRG